MCHFFGGWCKARHQRHSGKGARQDRNAYGVCLLSHCQAACLHVQTIHYIMHDHISCMSQTAASRRPHRPRCPEIRKIYKFAGLPLPGLGFMMHAFVVRQVSVDLWEQVHHTGLGKDSDTDDDSCSSTTSVSDSVSWLHPAGCLQSA